VGERHVMTIPARVVVCLELTAALLSTAAAASLAADGGSVARQRLGIAVARGMPTIPPNINMSQLHGSQAEDTIAGHAKAQ